MAPVSPLRLEVQASGADISLRIYANSRNSQVTSRGQKRQIGFEALCDGGSVASCSRTKRRPQVSIKVEVAARPRPLLCYGPAMISRLGSLSAAHV
jgi:hypothetical protein